MSECRRLRCFNFNSRFCQSYAETICFSAKTICIYHIPSNSIPGLFFFNRAPDVALTTGRKFRGWNYRKYGIFTATEMQSRYTPVMFDKLGKCGKCYTASNIKATAVKLSNSIMFYDTAVTHWNIICLCIFNKKILYIQYKHFTIKRYLTKRIRSGGILSPVPKKNHGHLQLAEVTSRPRLFVGVRNTIYNCNNEIY